MNKKVTIYKQDINKDNYVTIKNNIQTEQIFKAFNYSFVWSFVFIFPHLFISLHISSVVFLL